MYLGGLCFVTDTIASHLPYEDMVLQVLRTGIRWIQYRDKTRSRREIFRESLKLRAITRDFRALLIINDHPDIALAADADGVHLGQDDLPSREARRIMGENKLVGISTHSVEQAIDAAGSGADYIGFGPVFHTTTKEAGTPQGLSALMQIKRSVPIPVVAIGGISATNVDSVLGAGADAVAVASAILKGNIPENARDFLEVIRSHEEAIG